MKNIVFAFVALFFTCCATIPQATVDMSAQLENQLYAIKQANTTIVNAAYDSQEKRVTDYADDVLLPAYLEELFTNPEIADIWDGMVTRNDASERYEVMMWLNRNIQRIYSETRDSLLMPIREERLRILKSFDEEFDKAIRMNSVVMRNIASVSEIQQAYEKIASKFIDTNRLDSLVTNSLYLVDEKLNSIQKGVDAYEKNKGKIDEILNKLK